MRKLRFGAAAALAAAGLLAAGCSGGTAPKPEPSTEPTTSNALASFDPCTALTPTEIRSFGAAPEGKPNDLGIGEVGCDYMGEDFEFGVLKAGKSDEAYWQQRRNSFDAFTPNQVGSHSGFAGIALSGKGQGVCRQMMYVGSGSVIVDITYSADKIQSDDATCAKAMEIAQVVEPKLPM
ncbi:DUF3558 family protein [Saccharopolyspora hattusasensis]|uniref:DUF3558 family protein n=1 Tax=Saccharopolyspora hattusasensis TaxID=1128679 RepID=UPI003D952C43